jgi:hypothetical protein
MRARIVAAVALVASLSAVAPSSARTEKSSVAPTAPAAAVALAWNANAVAAVRAASVIDPLGTAARPLYQTEGLLYMSYVQAAVYDAATKIGHRYLPYHRFSVAASNASLQAAVIAAAYYTLVFYLGDPGGTLAAKYAASIAALPGDRATARGIAVGQAAAADIEALRAHDGRNAPVSTPFGAGPLQPGLWVFAPPPSPQIAQSPWMAVMHPFMLDSTSQVRAPAPPALTSALYTRDFNETKAYGSATSAARTAAQTAIAYFWNANAINQLNQTLQNVATQHNMDLLDTVRLMAAGNMVPTDAGLACFDSKYNLSVLAPHHRDPQRRHRRQPGDDRRSGLDAARHDAQSSRVPLATWMRDQRAGPSPGERARHQPHQRNHPGRAGRRHDANHVADVRDGA